MTRALLGARDVAQVMVDFDRALERHRETINRLNVYPVPDGDTGTNMHLTLESVCRELEALADKGDMEATCKAISHGSLMGARGNSGVILCQILRGMTNAFVPGTGSPGEAVGPPRLVAGLREANIAARAAVMKPVEGTILTVVAAAAEAAARLLAADGPKGATRLVDVAQAARSGAIDALWRTPEQLPVLAGAGVVDAGGAGLVLLFDALLEVIDDREPPAALPLPDAVVERISGGRDAATSMVGERPELAAQCVTGSPAELRYEVMYLLDAPDSAISAFKDVWAGIGDSIVVVGGDGIWNCHIHTNDVGPAVEAAIDVGRPRDIRVTDLMEQVEEESWVRRAAASAGAAPEEDLGPTPVTSVVAVATGDGIGRIFHSLGARHIVAGGQSMNPSTEEILKAMRASLGREVIVLPNNRNILAVASKACELSDKPARVVDTPGIQEGFAALLDYDPQVGAEANAAAMTSAAARITAGEVTQAVRASASEAGEILAGDWIAMSRRGIEAVASTAAEAAIALLDRLTTKSSEIVTIIEGTGATPAQTRRVTEWLAEHHPDVGVELHHGGQPLYPYLLSVE